MLICFHHRKATGFLPRKLHRFAIALLGVLAMVVGSAVCFADAVVTFEAESGTLGSNFTNGTAGAIQFISISTDTVNGGNPGMPAGWQLIM